MDDVIALRHAGNVNPLAAELFEIPVGSPGSDALEVASEAAALVVITVFQQIFQAERLLVPLGSYRAIEVQELVIGETGDVVVVVTWRKNKEPLLDIGIRRIRGASYHQVAVSSIDQHGVKSQESPIAGPAYRAFHELAARCIKEAIHDLHLGSESFGIYGQVGLAAVLVDGKQTGDIGALR